MTASRRKPRWVCRVQPCPLEGRWQRVTPDTAAGTDQHAHYLAEHFIPVEAAP